MKKVLKRLPDSALMPFIRHDKASNVLHVRMEPLCEFLIRTHHRTFSVSVFEEKLQNEIRTKLIGKPLTEKNLKALCKYIDELGIYLSDSRNKVMDGKIPQNAAKEFFHRHKDKYTEILNRSKKDRPQEYAVLLKRYKQRFESD